LVIKKEKKEKKAKLHLQATEKSNEHFRDFQNVRKKKRPKPNKKKRKKKGIQEKKKYYYEIRRILENWKKAMI